MMVRNHLDDQAMSKLLMKSTHNKKVLKAHKKVLEAHEIVLEAHKSFRFSSNSSTLHLCQSVARSLGQN